ncbi:MAG TPA: excinuclease ABC subunit UvrC [Gemmatimonadaceae bacterium]|nr:excinuclease ABC subunit UvrC [Gemmatimonadaceae bacterium]
MHLPTHAALAAKVATLPESPGVYLWKGADGTVLYVGKAKRLRARVRSYLGADAHEASKTRALMRQAVDVETIVVPSEVHALVLEANLIKEHHPRYNILLRDDKSYPFIKVTLHEPFPRVLVTRRVVEDGSRYFGPYTDVGAMRRALNLVNRIFTVRSCSWDLPREAPERACLDYHIGRCKAPCVGLQTERDYRAMIDEVVLFLDGRAGEVMRRVRERMAESAGALDFERAAELRDMLASLEKMEEPTVIVEVEGGDRDVLGFARDGDEACVVLLRIRAGKLLAREHQYLANVSGESDGAVLEAYLTGGYRPAEGRAAELVLPFDVEDRETIEQALAGTVVKVPQRGPRRALVDLAEQNARHLLEELRLAGADTEERAADPVYELQRELALPRVPRAIACFDISTAQGTDTVASCVWFENGRPRRGEYRKLRIKTVEGTDDFASMREAVTRTLRRRLDEQRPLPDLVLIDGGKGQLGAAREALESLGLGRMELASLAKREEDVYLSGRGDPIHLSRRSPALRLLQRVRDEAHRFAITYNRKRRAMRTVTSELLSIPGVGPTKRRALLRAFGSLQGVRDATAEQIAALPGFSAAGAQRILDALRERAPDPSPETAPADAPTPADD